MGSMWSAQRQNNKTFCKQLGDVLLNSCKSIKKILSNVRKSATAKCKEIWKVLKIHHQLQLKLR